MDADEAAGLPGAVALAEVIEHRTGFILGQVGAEEWSALAFGEAVLTNPAVEEADVFVLAEAAADGEVGRIPTAVEGAVGIQTAEARKVVHGSEIAGRCPGLDVWKRM